MGKVRARFHFLQDIVTLLQLWTQLYQYQFSLRKIIAPILSRKTIPQDQLPDALFNFVNNTQARVIKHRAIKRVIYIGSLYLRVSVNGGVTL